MFDLTKATNVKRSVDPDTFEPTLDFELDGVQYIWVPLTQCNDASLKQILNRWYKTRVITRIPAKYVQKDERLDKAITALQAVADWADDLGYYSEQGTVLAPIFQDVKKVLKELKDG